MWKKAEELLAKDRYLKPLIKKCGSCTIMPLSSRQYFEDLVDAICSQQLSIKAAKTIFLRVKKSLVKVNSKNILSKTDQELRDCGLSWAKVKYIKDLATKVLKKEIDINNLNNFNDQEVIKQLVAVKGIGKWTAEMFLMFSLARADVFPIDDLGIQKGYTKTTGKKWNPKSAARFAEKNWKPYRTVASWYLWRSLENS